MSLAAPVTPADSISETEADARLTLDRGDMLALIAKADRRREAGDNRAAQAYYAAALRLAATRPSLTGTPADAVRRAEAAIAWLGEIFRHHLLDSLATAGYPRESQHPRFRKSLDIMLGNAQRAAEYMQYPQIPLVHYYPDTRYLTFADTRDFEWVPRLEAAFPALRDEALALLADHDGFAPYVTADASRPQADYHGMLENPNWSSFHLWQHGEAVAENIARVPSIYRVVTEYVPLCHIGPRAPSIMLSLLRPGARIPPHTGMLNSRLICHLPLIVPPGCGFRVGGDTIEWQEGKVIVFDDSVEHEAWNNSAFDRLVVIFDIWRPELTGQEREQITAMFAAVDSYG